MTNAVYLGNHTALVRTVFGRKMYVDTRDTVVSPHLLLDGDWEPWIREFLRHVLRPGMRFVDVGAHLGWYTLLACDLVGAEGKVTAFEPNEGHAKLLERSLRINGFKAEVAHGACSDHDGPVPYAVLPEFSGNGRIVSEKSARQAVSAVRLDHYCREADFVKIDAEGHEAHVLRGMAEIIEACPRIQLLVEHHDRNNMEAFKAELVELDKLVSAGFKLGVVEHDGHVSELSLPDLGDVADSEMLYLAR